MALKLTDNKGKSQIIANTTETAAKIESDIRKFLSQVGLENYEGEPISELAQRLSEEVGETNNKIENLSANINGKLNKDFIGPESTLVKDLEISQNVLTGEATLSGYKVSPVSGTEEPFSITFNTQGGGGDTSEIQSQVDRIKEVIPDQANKNNQLADKAFVASSILNSSNHRVTKDAEGNIFASKAELLAATEFFYQGQSHVLDAHDYTFVNQDESAPSPFTNGQTRYEYDGTQWNYAFGISGKPFTPEEEAALNSGITSGIVDLAKSAYQKPSTGIPSSDLSEPVLQAIQNGGNSYKKPETGIPSTDLSQPVRDSLSKADTAVQPAELNNYVEKEDGKGLSSSDYTAAEKEKLSNVEFGAQKNKIEELKAGDKILVPVEGSINLADEFKTINGSSIFGTGDLEIAGKNEVVNLTDDQEIDGNKKFKKPLYVPAKSEGTTKHYEEVATEDQLNNFADYLEENALFKDSQINASQLTGNLPSTLGFPTLNQNTTGNAATADKLKQSVKVKLTGKATSSLVSFDGTEDLSIEVTGLSDNPNDYPILNQDTTGKSGSADKLSSPVGVTVNLGKSGETSFTGEETETIEIPVKGRLPIDKLPLGFGTGERRKALATVKASAPEGDTTGGQELELTTLDKTDVGLGNVLNEEQATKTEFNGLKARVTSLENKGVFIGSFNTKDDLPTTKTAIEGFTIDVNDFATVRSDVSQTVGDTVIPAGARACYTVSTVTGDTVTWKYDFTYSEDISGKIDKVPGKEDQIPLFNATGNLKSSGYGFGDLVKNDSTYQNVRSKAEGSRQKSEKIAPADLSGGTYDISISGNAATASEATKVGSADVGSATRPIYLNKGVPTAGNSLGNMAFKDYPTGTGDSGYVSFNNNTKEFTYSNELFKNANIETPGLMTGNQYATLYYPYVAYVDGGQLTNSLPTFMNKLISNTATAGGIREGLNPTPENNKFTWVAPATEDGEYSCEIPGSVHGRGKIFDTDFWVPHVRTFLVEEVNGNTVLTETYDSAEINVSTGKITIYSNTNLVNCLVLISQ